MSEPIEVTSDPMARLLVALFGDDDDAGVLAALKKDYSAPIGRDALRKALEWRRNDDLFNDPDARNPA